MLLYYYRFVRALMGIADPYRNFTRDVLVLLRKTISMAPPEGRRSAKLRCDQGGRVTIPDNQSKTRSSCCFKTDAPRARVAPTLNFRSVVPATFANCAPRGLAASCGVIAASDKKPAITVSEKRLGHNSGQLRPKLALVTHDKRLVPYRMSHRQ